MILGFANVPVDQVDRIEEKFNEVIHGILNHPNHEDLMSRMGVIIDRAVLSRRMNVENSPDVIPDAAILDLLYSESDDDIVKLLRMEDESDALLAKKYDVSFWLNLLNETFIQSPRVLLKGVPNIELNEQLYADEEERVRLQIKTLGPEGLKSAGDKVKRAIDSQALPPNSVLETVPTAGVDSIAWRKLVHYNHSSKPGPQGFDLAGIPFRFYFDDIRSQFVRVYMFLDMANVPEEDKPYLVILTETWLDAPIKLANGTVLHHDDVIKNRSKTAQSFYNDIGYKGGIFTPGSQSHLMMFYAEARDENYLDVVEMMKNALLNVEFSADRAKSKLSQLLNRIPGLKSKASSVTSALYDNIYFRKDSMMHHTSFLRQKRILQSAIEELEKSPGTLIARLHRLRQLIVTPQTCFVHMAADSKRLVELHGENTPTDVWKSFYDDAQTALEPTPERDMSKRYPLFSEHTFRDPRPSYRHAIVSISTSESCYVYQGINYNNTDWEVDEAATVRVMLQYLTDRMYDQIRGKGWTYHISMSASITEGRMKVTFSRSSSLANAFNAFREIIEGYYEGRTKWDPILLQSAKGSLVYSWVETQDSPEDLSSSSVLALLRQAKDSFYVPRFVKRLSEVSVEEVQAVAEKYLPSFANVNQTHTAIVCSPSQFEDVKTLLTDKYGFDLTVIDDLENSILTS